MNVEAIFGEVDRDLAHIPRDASFAPAREDTSGIGAEGYYVTEDLERGEGLVNDGGMAVPDAFYGCCEATKAYY